MHRAPHTHRWLATCMAAMVPAMILTSNLHGQEASASDLPAAKTLIDKYIDAIGGKDAQAKVTSRHITGTFSVPSQSASGPMEVFSAAPNKHVVHISIPNVGDIWNGFDGETGWIMHPMLGNRVLDGAPLKEMQESAEFLDFTRYDKYTKSMETVEETDFEGKPCYKVKLVDNDGKESFEYFEKDTGLLRGESGQRETLMGPIDVVTITTDWKDVDGLKFPARTLQRVRGTEQVIAVDKIELNNVDPSVFDLPEEIKKIKSGEAPATQGKRPPGLTP